MTSTTELDRKLNGGDNPKPTVSGEEDPCIDETNKMCHKHSFRDRTEEKLREKSGLSRRGLIIAGVVLLALFIMLIIVIALAAAWPRALHHQQFPVCRNAACLRASAQIQEALNTSAAPCSDVWKWACGGWLYKNPLPPDRSRWNKREQLRVQEATRIRNLISTLPLPMNPSSVEWKMKRLYESCMEIENIDADGIRPLHNIITELGGWHVMRDWSVHSWDYRRVLERLHAEYGATPFFKITVEPNPRSPTNNSIRISPSGLGLPDRSFYYADSSSKIIEAYKRLLRDVIILFRASSSEAQKFGTDIFFYEKRIAEITPTTQFLQDPVNTYNPIIVSELKITAASLPLREILVSMFPKAGISEDTEIIVSSPDYLTAVSGIVSSTDKSTLNNYVIWTLIRKYLPYLPTDFTADLQQYVSQLTGVQNSLARWEICSNMLQKFMGLAINSKFETNEPISEVSLKTVENVFKSIRNATLLHIKEYNFPNELKKHLKQKVSGLTVQIGLPKNTLEIDYLKNYYNKLYVQKSNLFHNIENGLLFLRRVQQEQYMDPKPESRYISYYTETDLNAVYLPAVNSIIIPQALLTNPSFDAQYPASVIYGRLGVNIAKAVISSILPYDSSWTKDKGLLSPYHQAVNQSIKVSNYPRGCLSKFLTKFGLASTEVAELTSLSTLKQLSAVRVAHTALQLTLEKSEHIHQPTLEIYEDSAMFYLTYTQELCSQYTHEEELQDNFVSFKLSEKVMSVITWNQIRDFPNSFECEFSKNDQCIDIL